MVGFAGTEAVPDSIRLLARSTRSAHANCPSVAQHDWTLLRWRKCLLPCARGLLLNLLAETACSWPSRKDKMTDLHPMTGSFPQPGSPPDPATLNEMLARNKFLEGKNDIKILRLPKFLFHWLRISGKHRCRYNYDDVAFAILIFNQLTTNDMIIYLSSYLRVFIDHLIPQVYMISGHISQIV